MLSRIIPLTALLLALPAEGQTILDRLRANVREAVAESDAPPLRRLEQAATNVESAVRRVERHVDDSVQFLRDIGPCGEPREQTVAAAPAPHEELQTIPDEVERAFAELEESRDEARALLTPQSPPRFREAVRRAVEAADEMLTRRRDSSIAARWLRRFADERRRSTTHQDLCRLLDSVAPLPEPFTMEDVRRDPLVPLRRIDEAVRRQLLHRNNALHRGEWSLGLGAMWTPMKAGPEGNRETRAGQPIAMLGFRPLPEDLPILRDSAFRPWFQIGTGLQFDEPSFYVGGALELGPYAHLGVGWTAQQVDDENGDEEFDGDVYVSLTVRLERLRRWQ